MTVESDFSLRPCDVAVKLRFELKLGFVFQLRGVSFRERRCLTPVTSCAPSARVVTKECGINRSHFPFADDFTLQIMERLYTLQC